MLTTNISRRFIINLFVVAVLTGTLASGQAQADFNKSSDIVYANVDGQDLALDLYQPEAVNNPPLLVYIHGGAWRSGSKEGIPTTAFVEDGYAMASVEFRMSGVAKFPAQIHDIRSSIRFLRAKADEYGYNADKIAILGSSSGGHLVALLGVTNGHPDLEGEVGGYFEQSSDVQAVVDYYGASNLTTILDQSTPLGLNVRKPALDLFIGGQPEDVPEIAKLASPVFHVDENSVPLLMLHGDQDPQMPINQSHELYHAYQQQGLPVQFEVVHGASHGGPMFTDAKHNDIVRQFLDKHLR